MDTEKEAPGTKAAARKRSRKSAAQGEKERLPGRQSGEGVPDTLEPPPEGNRREEQVPPPEGNRREEQVSPGGGFFSGEQGDAQTSGPVEHGRNNRKGCVGQRDAQTCEPAEVQDVGQEPMHDQAIQAGEEADEPEPLAHDDGTDADEGLAFPAGQDGGNGNGRRGRGRCERAPWDDGPFADDDPEDGAFDACDGSWSAADEGAGSDSAADDVAQAQECLSDRWFEAGATTIVCEAPDMLDEEGDLGRYDVHDPHQLGELGEHIAARYLKRWGYTILERNYRTEYGEADIVCTKDDTIVLVEVKTRLGADALPEEAVTAQKIRKYRKITLSYTMSHEWFDSVRLDALAINIVKPRRAQVHHFMGVCEWEG